MCTYNFDRFCQLCSLEVVTIYLSTGTSWTWLVIHSTHAQALFSLVSVVSLNLYSPYHEWAWASFHVLKSHFNFISMNFLFLYFTIFLLSRWPFPWWFVGAFYILKKKNEPFGSKMSFKHFPLFCLMTLLTAFSTFFLKKKFFYSTVIFLCNHIDQSF